MSGRVLIYGGKGALGSVIVSHFKSKNWWVASIDMTVNEAADANVVIDPAADWEQQDVAVCKRLDEVLPEGEKLDSVLCVAGGWAGGNAASKNLVKNCSLMVKQSVWTSVIAASVAAKHLKEGGALVLTGAEPALGATPGMMAYGMAKAAVHQFVQSLAGKNAGLPKDAYVGAIVPVTMDTPMNRKFMPDADQTVWTPLEFVAELLMKWTENVERPPSGSLIKLVTKEGATSLVPADILSKVVAGTNKLNLSSSGDAK